MSNPYEAPAAKVMAKTILDQAVSSFDHHLAKKKFVYVRGYQMPVDPGDIKRFRKALRDLEKIRDRVVLRAAEERKAISKSLR